MVNQLNSTDRYRIIRHVLLFFIGCAVVLAVVAPLALRPPGEWSNFVLGTITSLGTLALSALFVRWDGLSLRDIGAVPEGRSLLRFASGFLVGLLLVALHAGMAGYVCHVRWIRAWGVGLAPTAIALVSYFVLSCREELAFRGYPLRRLERPFGLWGAQLIVAIVFAVEHVAGGSTWMHAFLGAGVGSLLFGMAALTTRGLAMPIGLHAAWNFGGWMLGEKESSGLWRTVVEERFQARFEFAGTFSYILVMVSATLVFLFWYSRIKYEEVRL